MVATFVASRYQNPCNGYESWLKKWIIFMKII